jgi:putative ABC transport system substrate-binding protein
MRRRDFVKLAGSAVPWPLVVQAQQGERTRRVGVLMGVAEDDPLTSAPRRLPTRARTPRMVRGP